MTDKLTLDKVAETALKARGWCHLCDEVAFLAQEVSRLKAEISKLKRLKKKVVDDE